jgi:hypothetical protein
MATSYWLVLALFLTSCATGYPLLSIPPPPDPTQSAEIVWIRPSGFVGAAATSTLRLDGRDIYELGPGEHLSVRVAPGEHVIGSTGCRYACLVPYRPTATVQAQPGGHYYFEVGLTDLTQLPEAEGRAAQARTDAGAQRFRE